MLSPVFKTVATNDEGVAEVDDYIKSGKHKRNSRKEFLLAEKAWRIIQQKRMANVDKQELQREIAKAMLEGSFNLYAFIEKFI